MNVFCYECELQLQTLAEPFYPNTSISDIQSAAEQLQQETKGLKKRKGLPHFEAALFQLF